MYLNWNRFQLGLVYYAQNVLSSLRSEKFENWGRFLGVSSQGVDVVSAAATPTL